MATRIVVKEIVCTCAMLHGPGYHDSECAITAVALTLAEIVGTEEDPNFISADDDGAVFRVHGI